MFELWKLIVQDTLGKDYGIVLASVIHKDEFNILVCLAKCVARASDNEFLNIEYAKDNRDFRITD